MKFIRFLSSVALMSCLSVYSGAAVAQVTEKVSNSTSLSQAKPIKGNNKEPSFVNVTVQRRSIPVCTDSGVALERDSFKDTLRIGRYAIAHQGNEYLGRWSVLKITCKVMEFRTERSNYLDFRLLWSNFLKNFRGSYDLVEGEPSDGPYALYRLVYPDKYVQYIAVYFQPAGSLQISVGSFPRDEKLSRQTLILMMTESGLGRPGLK
jgi:hypothetical protein